MSSILGALASNLIGQAPGMFGGSQAAGAPVNSLVNAGVGIFQNMIAPQAVGLGGGISTMLIPQNTAGLGVFSNVTNAAPVAKIGNAAIQLTSSGAQQIGTQVLQQVLGQPTISNGPATTQQQSGTSSMPSSKDDSLLWIIAAGIIGKLLKVF